MSLESDISVLEKVALLTDFTEDQLRLLAFGCADRLLSGETLFRAFARSDAGFVTVSGEVELMQGKLGPEVTVARLGPGALLGEIALITDTTGFVTARTLSERDLIRIPRALFRRMLEEYPDLAISLQRRLAGELGTIMQRISEFEARFD